MVVGVETFLAFKSKIRSWPILIFSLPVVNFRGEKISQMISTASRTALSFVALKKSGMTSGATFKFAMYVEGLVTHQHRKIMNSQRWY